MVPSPTSIDVTILQTQSNSVVPDTNVFIVQTAYSFKQSSKHM